MSSEDAFRIDYIKEFYSNLNKKEQVYLGILAKRDHNKEIKDVIEEMAKEIEEAEEDF